MVIYIVFFVKSRADRIIQERTNRQLQLAYDPNTALDEVTEGDPLYPQQTAIVERTFELRFADLGLILPTGVDIMRGVTGKLSSGRSCAIMGPSGSGKTTFLHLLSGKVQRTTGVVEVNGMEEELSTYKKLVGYVPQEDIMIRELKVGETLMHSALSRLPAKLPRKAKEALVYETVKLLQLENVYNSVIGTVEKRGISGGQRKRVNIGMELVANPSLLLLDEPTTGLDSSVALEIVKLLAKLARQQQLLVAAVVHAPSQRAFHLFDDLLLLGKGGRVIYQGAISDAPAYFELIGFPIPQGQNPADHYLAVSANKVRSAYTADFVPADLFSYWDRYCRGVEPLAHSKGGNFHKMAMLIPSADNPNGQGHDEDGGGKWGKASLRRCFPSGAEIVHRLRYATRAVYAALHDTWTYFLDVGGEFLGWILSFLPSRLSSHSSSSLSGASSSGSGGGINSITKGDDDTMRRTPNGFVLFWLFFIRACKQSYRSKGKFIYDQLLHLGCGALISLAGQHFDYLGRQPEAVCELAPISLQERCREPIETIGYIGIFISMGVVFSGMSMGSHTFGGERVVFWREAAAGTPALPYFLAKVISDLPRAIFAALCFSLAFIVFFAYRSMYAYIYVICFLLYLCSFAMGYFVSICLAPHVVGLANTVFALLWAVVFNGVIPSLDVVNAPGNGYDHLRWLWALSAPRYATEAFFVKEVGARPFFEVKEGILPHDFHIDNFPLDLGAMFGIAVGWNAMAFLALKLLRRSKQK